MRETDPSDEENTPARLEYGAVPLDPWQATVADHTAVDAMYMMASLARIEKKLTRAMVDLRLFEDDRKLAHEVYEVMRVSLRDSQMQRIKHNPVLRDEDEVLIENEQAVDPEDPRVIRAKEGHSTPSELFSVLKDYPGLGSLELAKLSHPFDFTATEAMDRDIDGVLLDSGGELLTEPPRYKMKRVHPQIPAGVLLRKQDLMRYPTEAGPITVVKRQGLLVLGYEGANHDPYLERKIKNFDANEKHRETLCARLEQLLHDKEELTNQQWLFPQATSYYAKYSPGPEVASGSDR